MKIPAMEVAFSVSLIDGTATFLGVQNTDCEIDITDYAMYKANELIELHKQGIDMDEYLANKVAT